MKIFSFFKNIIYSFSRLYILIHELLSMIWNKHIAYKAIFYSLSCYKYRFGYSGYKKADTGLSSKHSNGGSLDRYTADPNQRGVQARADIIRPRPTPCKLQIPHQSRKTSSPVVKPACVYIYVLLFHFLAKRFYFKL